MQKSIYTQTWVPYATQEAFGPPECLFMDPKICILDGNANCTNSPFVLHIHPCLVSPVSICLQIYFYWHLFSVGHFDSISSVPIQFKCDRNKSAFSTTMDFWHFSLFPQSLLFPLPRLPESWEQACSLSPRIQCVDSFIHVFFPHSHHFRPFCCVSTSPSASLQQLSFKPPAPRTLLLPTPSSHSSGTQSLPCMWPASWRLPFPLSAATQLPLEVLCHHAQQIQNCQPLHSGASSPTHDSPRDCFLPQVSCMFPSSHSSAIILHHGHSAPPRERLGQIARLLTGSGGAPCIFCSWSLNLQEDRAPELGSLISLEFCTSLFIRQFCTLNPRLPLTWLSWISSSINILWKYFFLKL